MRAQLGTGSLTSLLTMLLCVRSALILELCIMNDFICFDSIGKERVYIHLLFLVCSSLHWLGIKPDVASEIGAIV